MGTTEREGRGASRAEEAAAEAEEEGEIQEDQKKEMEAGLCASRARFERGELEPTTGSDAGEDEEVEAFPVASLEAEDEAVDDDTLPDGRSDAVAADCACWLDAGPFVLP